MELQDRKMKILQAIIRNYLETGEPVGSRTISKYTDLKLSSATIRNEMADLEEMGLIMQPHTSAGRIPTDAGYRLYVDNMLSSERRQVDEMKSVLLEKQDRLENLLQQVAKLLATNTNYASMISSPMVRQNKIKFIQLSQVDEGSILAVIVLEGNLIRNRVIHVDQPLDAEQMLKLNMLLNTNLCGLPVEEITLGLIESIKRDAGIHTEIVSDVFDAAADIVRSEDDLKIYTSGANNIFRYPELADHRKASEIISDFEEKQALTSIVRESLSESSETGIQVYIGNEMPVNSMRDCSVVTATYDLGDGMKGTVGIIGPRRMDYEKVVGVLRHIMKQLDDLYKQ
ncbi:MAG TPA: heat-inducible transcription repressor HrcA [Lachnospiraceae bacterium]|nr:heat-inducible transcription repressor HrcA [Lachnospiraceae bacterium]